MRNLRFLYTDCVCAIRKFAEIDFMQLTPPSAQELVALRDDVMHDGKSMCSLKYYRQLFCRFLRKTNWNGFCFHLSAEALGHTEQLFVTE